MRILHVVSTLHIGGVERLVSELAVAQLQRGQQPAVYCYSHKTGDLLRPLTSAQAPVFGPTQAVDGQQRRTDLSQCINTWRPDVVHSHLNFSILSQVWACARAGGWRPKIITTEHTAFQKPLSLVLRSMLNDRLARPFISRFTAVSRSAGQHAARFYGLHANKVAIIYNGVASDQFPFDRQARDQRREALQLPPNAVVWGAVGRLVPVKGHDVLLRAFALARQTDPRLYLIVVGSGPEAEPLRQLARMLGCEPYVIWPGATDAVASWLSVFDYFVHPSRYETLSLAILEALANGLAVTATRVGGVAEIQDYSPDVDLLPSENVPALAEAMTRRAAQPPVARAEPKLPDTFRFETMYQQYMAQYQALAA